MSEEIVNKNMLSDKDGNLTIKTDVLREDHEYNNFRLDVDQFSEDATFTFISLIYKKEYKFTKEQLINFIKMDPLSQFFEVNND